MSRWQKAAYQRYLVREAKRDRYGLGNATGTQAGFRFPTRKLRQAILKRDHYLCRYCGVKVNDANANIDLA